MESIDNAERKKYHLVKGNHELSANKDFSAAIFHFIKANSKDDLLRVADVLEKQGRVEYAEEIREKAKELGRVDK